MFHPMRRKPSREPAQRPVKHVPQVLLQAFAQQDAARRCWHASPFERSLRPLAPFHVLTLFHDTETGFH